MKKTIFATIIIACVAVFAVGNIAYSYFGANLNITNNLQLGAIFTGDYTPVFTAESEGNLMLTVTDADMLLANVDNNNVAVSATGNINVTLDAVGDEKNSTATCTFKFVFEDLSTDGSEYTKYTPSANLNGDKEFTVKILDTSNGSSEVVAEKNVSELIGSDNVLSDNLSISAKGSKTTKNYQVVASIYNLNLDQTGIKNKKFGFKIETQAVECKIDGSE